MLDAFTLNIGKISLKDMTGEEIAKELAAVFGKVGDEMALAVIPQLAEIQQVGEGTFETLARAVAEFAAVAPVADNDNGDGYSCGEWVSSFRPEGLAA